MSRKALSYLLRTEEVRGGLTPSDRRGLGARLSGLESNASLGALGDRDSFEDRVGALAAHSYDPFAPYLTNLVGYWKMEEASGATREDSIGSNDLNNPGTAWTQVAGKHGFAAQGAGSGQLESTSLVAPGGAFTFEMWLKATAATQETLLVLAAGDFMLVRSVIAEGDIAVLDYNTSAYAIVTADPVVPGGSFHHLLVVFDGSQPTQTDRIKVYVDGAFKAWSLPPLAGNVPSTFDTDSLLIGNGSTVVFDEMALWSVALEASDATALYNSGDGLFLA